MTVRRVLPIKISLQIENNLCRVFRKTEKCQKNCCPKKMIAAILFFMERDNDTFKNLRTIPVTSTQMVLAKIIVLFIFGIVL